MFGKWMTTRGYVWEMESEDEGIRFGKVGSVNEVICLVNGGEDEGICLENGG